MAHDSSTTTTDQSYFLKLISAYRLLVLSLIEKETKQSKKGLNVTYGYLQIILI